MLDMNFWNSCQSSNWKRWTCLCDMLSYMESSKSLLLWGWLLTHLPLPHLPPRSCVSINNLHLDFAQISQVMHQLPKHVWHPPPSNFLKLNVDVNVWWESSGCCSFKWLSGLRDGFPWSYENKEKFEVCYWEMFLTVHATTIKISNLSIG